ncbi:DsrE family protein [Salinisphaera aquimarina]|uniref:Intracellular sulfur oxidation protein, DsrE/DsrF family n=1 Tax=Salinisphaera aquimarina TaxID=2094031 RepID=A0ABV7EPE5_9GAMM
MIDQPPRLIIHAADEASLSRARSNAANFLAAVDNGVVEIVINADAVAPALATPHATDTHLRVCANTLHNQQLEAPDHLVQVAAAVVYITDRQRDGWAYIRA